MIGVKFHEQAVPGFLTIFLRKKRTRDWPPYYRRTILGGHFMASYARTLKSFQDVETNTFTPVTKKRERVQTCSPGLGLEGEG